VAIGGDTISATLLRRLGREGDLYGIAKKMSGNMRKLPFRAETEGGDGQNMRSFVSLGGGGGLERV